MRQKELALSMVDKQIIKIDGLFDSYNEDRCDELWITLNDGRTIKVNMWVDGQYGDGGLNLSVKEE